MTMLKMSIDFCTEENDNLAIDQEFIYIP